MNRFNLILEARSPELTSTEIVLEDLERHIVPLAVLPGHDLYKSLTSSLFLQQDVYIDVFLFNRANWCCTLDLQQEMRKVREVQEG